MDWLLCFALGGLAHSQSLFDQRARAIGEERTAHYHALYRQRTAEMVGLIEAKLQRAAAPYGGATNFAYACEPRVSGTTFLTCGITFQTNREEVGCKIDNFGYDLILCKGEDFTNCPDFSLNAVCIDRNNKSFYLGEAAKGGRVRRR